jgi:hypothetical protein
MRYSSLLASHNLLYPEATNDKGRVLELWYCPGLHVGMATHPLYRTVSLFIGQTRSFSSWRTDCARLHTRDRLPVPLHTTPSTCYRQSSRCWSTVHFHNLSSLQHQFQRRCQPDTYRKQRVCQHCCSCQPGSWSSLHLYGAAYDVINKLGLVQPLTLALLTSWALCNLNARSSEPRMIYKGRNSLLHYSPVRSSCTRADKVITRRAGGGADLAATPASESILSSTTSLAGRGTRS